MAEELRLRFDGGGCSTQEEFTDPAVLLSSPTAFTGFGPIVLFPMPNIPGKGLIPARSRPGIGRSDGVSLTGVMVREVAWDDFPVRMEVCLRIFSISRFRFSISLSRILTMSLVATRSSFKFSMSDLS